MAQERVVSTSTLRPGVARHSMNGINGPECACSVAL